MERRTASSSSFVPRQLAPVLRTVIYAGPALVFFILFSYVPFFRSIYLSLFVTDAAGEAVRFNGLNYYIRILGFDDQPRFMQSMLTSAKFALMVVPASIVSGLGLAWLAAVKLPYIKVFRTIFTGSLAISIASAGVIWAMLYSPVIGITRPLMDVLKLASPSLLGSSVTALFAVAVTTVWTSLGFNFVITLAGIQAIPQDVYESGLLDGATGWTAFRTLTLPLLAPTLLFLLVVNSISSFQAFTQFNVLIGNEGPESSTNVFVFAAFKTFWLENRYGFASAMSIVLFVVLFVLTLIQFRGLDRRVHYQ